MSISHPTAHSCVYTTRSKCALILFSLTLSPSHTLSQISGREMFEFNPELVQGDDQEAGDDATLFSHHEEEEEEGEGEGEERGGEDGEEEEGEEGRDITDMGGYSEEVVAPPPPAAASSVATSSSQAETATGK